MLLTLAPGPVPAQSTTEPSPTQQPAPTESGRITRPIVIESEPPESPAPAIREWWVTPDLGCTGCGFEAGPGWLSQRHNANAPWVFQGMARRTTRFGTVSAGVAGVRNLAAPLYTMTPGGGLIDIGPASTSQANLSVTTTEWHARLAYERTLWKKGRVTLGFMAGAFMPISAAPVYGQITRLDPLPSRSLFVGFVLSW